MSAASPQGTRPPDLEILYRDAGLVAVAKPSGLPVHRGWSSSRWTAVGLLSRQLDGAQVHPLHRLDQGTSGVLLFALNPQLARQGHLLFENREVHKRYLAVVRGQPPQRGHLDYPIPRKPREARVAAQTAWRVLETRQIEPRTISLVEAVPESGRLHQVRRHLKHLTHPVLMDANHGCSPLNRAMRDRYGLTRLALHAYAVRLRHPDSGQLLEILAPLPADLTEPLARMGLELSLWQKLETWLGQDFLAQITDNERRSEGVEP